jgi:hypothetical protein
MRLGLVFSNDWELFGDGSGDYFETQHKPLEQLLAAVEGHGAKLTVMAEVGQQWAHRELGRSESWAAEIADAWEEIVRDTVRRGSDVQLHLHPQWLDARREANRWDLDYRHWAVSSLPAERMQTVFGDGKRYLESLARPVREDYECLVFRAGGFCIEPSGPVAAALRRAGFRCDTSVVKGLFAPGRYDYRDAHGHVVPWSADSQSVKRHEGRGGELLEWPVASVPVWDSPLLRKLLGFQYTRRLSSGDRAWAARRERITAERYPPRNRPGQSQSRRTRLQVSNLWRSWLRQTAVPLDYDNLAPGVFVDLLEKILQLGEVRSLRDEDIVLPVMLLGHAKTMPDCGNVERILEAIRRRLGNRAVFWTALEAVRSWEYRIGLSPVAPHQGVERKQRSLAASSLAGGLGSGRSNFNFARPGKIEIW